jgi:hypothetical protein
MTNAWWHVAGLIPQDELLALPANSTLTTQEQAELEAVVERDSIAPGLAPNTFDGLL